MKLFLRVGGGGGGMLDQIEIKTTSALDWVEVELSWVEAELGNKKLSIFILFYSFQFILCPEIYPQSLVKILLTLILCGVGGCMHFHVYTNLYYVRLSWDWLVELGFWRYCLPPPNIQVYLLKVWDLHKILKALKLIMWSMLEIIQIIQIIIFCQA